jgi:hypothetical protein
MNISLANPKILECWFTYGRWCNNMPDLWDLSLK